MNRDAILATIIGLALGLTITGLIVVGPGFASNLPKIKLPAFKLTFNSLSPSKAPAGSATQPKPPVFSVTSPLADAIETTSELVVSGTALPGSAVVVSGLTDDDVMSVGTDAKFAGKITLSEGRNEIAVTQYLKGKPTIIKVIIYYTKENI